MKRKTVTPSTNRGASGPVLAVCEGHRCGGLHRLADGQSGADRVRSTIANERGAVLISTGCLNACASGSVAAVARRDAAAGLIGPSLLLGGVDRPEVLDALLEWIERGGPAHFDAPAHGLPAALQDAVIGHL